MNQHDVINQLAALRDDALIRKDKVAQDAFQKALKLVVDMVVVPSSAEKHLSNRIDELHVKLAGCTCRKH